MRKKLMPILENLDLIVAGSSFIVIVCITFLGVVMRYIAGNPLVWLEEVQVWLFLWISYFGGSAAFRLKSHVEIGVIVERLPAKVQKIIAVVIYLIIVGTLGFLLVKGTQMVGFYARSNKSTSVLSIPSSLIYSAVPVGTALMIINYSIVVWKDFFCKESEGKNT